VSEAPRPSRAAERWFLALAIVVLDVVIVVVPITALTVAFLIVARPAWLRRWIDELYAGLP
jgi:hypothetical protein